MSGVCLLGPGGRVWTGHARTTVTFRALAAEAVATYVATGEWRERAGAYAIQGVGSALVSAVAGDYWNVVGLPVALLLDGLEAVRRDSVLVARRRRAARRAVAISPAPPFGSARDGV